MPTMPPLSDAGGRVMSLAAIESHHLRHGYIGPEHVFLGLCKTDDASVARAFRDATLDPVALRRGLRSQLHQGPAVAAAGQVTITDQAWRVFESVATILAQQQAPSAEPIHLLAAVLQHVRGSPLSLLTLSGVDLEALRRASVDAMAEAKKAPAAAGAGAAGASKLLRYGRDMTALAAEGKLPPLIGRKDELRRMAQILTRLQKNCVCLVGEPGVGKTCIVEGLALKCASPEAPDLIKGRRIIELQTASLVAGTSHRGEFEQRLKDIIQEAQDQNVILFIDEIHTLIGAGAGGGQSMDAADILKPALARGDLRCIGATTLAEYRQYIESDPALARRFQPVQVNEPSADETVQILHGVRGRFEKHHRAVLTDEALEAAVRLSVRYLRDRRLPDKAIDLIDEAASRLRLQSLTVNSQQAAQMKAQGQFSPTVTVTAETVAQVVAQWTGVPVDQMHASSRPFDLARLEETLRHRVIGQDHAVTLVRDVVRTAMAGLGNPNRPCGVFLFVGPTGVGKTELARALAEALFGDERQMIRLDMSEFTDEHSVSKLIGSPPGYVGSTEGGQLTNAVRNKPYCVLLMDEVEKAHHRVMDVFLQVFDEGRLTDSRGITADFTHSTIILTANIGADLAMSGFGFNKRGGPAQDADATVSPELLGRLKEHFRPEFINRIDEIVQFRPLDGAAMRRIVLVQTERVRQRLAEKGVQLALDEAALDWLAEHGFDPQFGARHLQRLIERELVRPLADRLLGGQLKAGTTVQATARKGQFELLPRTGRDALETVSM